MRTIYCDVDDCLFAFLQGAFRLIGMDPYGPEAVAAHRLDPYGSHIHAMFGGIEMFNSIIRDAGEAFWLNLVKFPWADELVRRLANIPGARLAFLTSPGAWPDINAGAKFRVLGREYPHVPVIVAHHKDLLAAPGKCLIDDRASNVHDFIAAGGAGMVWPNSHDLLGNPQLVLRSIEQAVAACQPRSGQEAA